jgi:hypothetical protein
MIFLVECCLTFSRAKLDPGQMLYCQNLIGFFMNSFVFISGLFHNLPGLDGRIRMYSIASFFSPIPGVISGPRSPTGPYIFLSIVAAHEKTETQPDPSEKEKCKRARVQHAPQLAGGYSSQVRLAAKSSVEIIIF